jgi:glucan phosphorylase
MTKWEDISDVLTKKGAAKVKVSQVLMFEFEGSPIHLKIMRKDGGKVWAKRMHLYKREELGKIKVVRKKDNAIRPEENNR